MYLRPRADPTVPLYQQVKFTLCKVVWAKPSGPLQGGTVGIFVVDIGAAQQRFEI